MNEMRKLMETIKKLEEHDHVNPRQDSTRDQLLDLITLAEQNGMYDASDYIKLVLKNNFQPVRNEQ